MSFFATKLYIYSMLMLAQCNLWMASETKSAIARSPKWTASCRSGWVVSMFFSVARLSSCLTTTVNLHPSRGLCNQTNSTL